MPALRVIILWHQHQPFYKDLVTGEYRLPWVRLHALKDYYGMVKLLDEFPNVHQTFNLVPSLITQIQDYVTGTAHDPFLTVAAKPAKELASDERRFALQYLFQANPVHMIGRYPRYHELWERFHAAGDSAERADKYFQAQDFTDLQVLSQIAWFDEFFLDQPDIAALIKKGRGFSFDDQAFVISRQRSLVGEVLPAHAAAAQQGRIEISTSPFYHPILPLVCDTRPRQNLVGVELPRLDVIAHGDAEEAPENWIVTIALVSGPAPHANGSIKNIEVCRQIEPEVVVRNIVGRGGMASTVDLPVSCPVARLGRRLSEEAEHVPVRRKQTERGCAFGVV